VVIHDLYVKCIAVLEAETHAPRRSINILFMIAKGSPGLRADGGTGKWGVSSEDFEVF
jgi:hypothetical protein